MSDNVFQYRETRREQIFNSGYSAYKNGEPVENNPYFEKDYQEAWDCGWHQGRWEDENE